MLSEEDKQWIAEQISSQIAASERRVVARLEKAETALLDYIEPRVEKIEARVEKTETTLLTEFDRWASPVEMRQRTHAAVLRAIDTEM